MLLQMSGPLGAMLVWIVGGFLLAGCSNETPAKPGSLIPTGPTVVAPPLPSVTVRGIVYDTALRPLAGAMVEVLNGAQAGNVATTGADGGFGFSGAFEDDTRFRATKDGHEAGVATLGAYCERCNPHHWVYFSLAVPMPPANLAGEYTLTVHANDACTMLPAEARSRTYPARVVAHTTQPTSANTIFHGTASGASLVSGLAWDGLWFYVAGDYVEMFIGDLHGQPGFVEQMGANTYFGFGGLGATSLGASVSMVSMTFDGDVFYCELKPGVAPLDASQRFTCGADQAVSRLTCPSRSHRIELARR